ncbi:hypothetical protein J6590_058811 [Homalodisca vitripennis]|nr:hypothetical protein J6590_058811 [Homalodisca vitripennis]
MTFLDLADVHSKSHESNAAFSEGRSEAELGIRIESTTPTIATFCDMAIFLVWAFQYRP